MVLGHPQSWGPGLSSGGGQGTARNEWGPCVKALAVHTNKTEGTPASGQTRSGETLSENAGASQSVCPRVFMCRRWG